MSNASIDGARLWADIMELAEITEPDRPFTRRSFTPRFLEGRSWLTRKLEAAGATVRLDTGGNLIARREGSDPSLPALVIGSHSDTVPSGGRFDGILGVLAGLEILRSLRDRGIHTRHPVEVIDFLAEEPSEYGLSCVGSRAICGQLGETELALRDPDGESLLEAVRRFGGNPDALARARRDDIAAFLELHIEQGRQLESSARPLGIVTGIVGIRRYQLVFSGAADHAGATPFDLRQDALVAAAGAIAAIRRIGEELAGQGEGYFIATVGRIVCAPNAANVVPGEVTLIVEARAEDEAQLDRFAQGIEGESTEAATSFRVRLSICREISRSRPALCEPDLRHHLTAAARDLGLPCQDLASGAGHDAAFMSRIAPAAMVFVPSREGKSHCPEEWTDAEHCSAGAAVMFEALLRVDADPRFDEARGGQTGIGQEHSS